jgi:hypothetical protein
VYASLSGLNLFLMIVWLFRFLFVLLVSKSFRTLGFGVALSAASRHSTLQIANSTQQISCFFPFSVVVIKDNPLMRFFAIATLFPNLMLQATKKPKQVRLKR